MLFKSSIYALIIMFPSILMSMEAELPDIKEQYDIADMLTYAIRPNKDSLKNICIYYLSYDSPLSVEQIEQLNIPETLIHEIRMRKIMPYLKSSPNRDFEYQDPTISPDLKRELILRKKQLFNSLMDKIKSNEKLLNLCKNIIDGLEETGDINYRFHEDFDAIIHVICKSGDLETLHHIIALGADVQLTLVHNYRPIHFFATIDIADCLLREGCDINALDKLNRTPLMILSSNKNTRIELVIEKAKFLLKHGCLNFANSDGNTAIMYAIHSNQKELVILYINSGAKLDAKNWAGKRVIDFAQELESKEIYEIIKSTVNK